MIGTKQGQEHTNNPARKKAHIHSLGDANEAWLNVGLKFLHPSATVAPSVSTGVATARLTGSEMVKRVPLPGVLSTWMAPPCAFAIQATKLSPNPRPRSGSVQVSCVGTR